MSEEKSDFKCKFLKRMIKSFKEVNKLVLVRTLHLIVCKLLTWSNKKQFNFQLPEMKFNHETYIVEKKNLLFQILTIDNRKYILNSIH